MMVSHVYYGNKMTHEDVKQRVDKLVNVLPRYLQSVGADAVVVTGLSGTSIAFGALAQLDFKLFVVRKTTEGSHGERIEGPQGAKVRKYVVLDDFVSSGATIRNIVQTVNEHSLRKGVDAPECVGVITHDGPNPFMNTNVRIMDASYVDIACIHTLYEAYNE